MGGERVSLARNPAAKNRNRKARAGKNSFPPTPFLFARPSIQFQFLPSRQRREQSIKVLFKKDSSGVQ
jgi:hypothetical protein